MTLMNLAKILLTIHGACAAEAPAFQWDEVRGMALDRNTGLQSAEKSWLANRAAKRGAIGDFLPNVSVSARRDRSVTEISSLESKSRTRQFSVAASWNLFNGFSTVANLQRAAALEEESLANRDVTSAELRYQLRRAFFTIYVQQARIELFERTLKRQLQNEKLVSLKYENGTEARWNVQKTKAERERAEYNLETAKAELFLARDNLAKLLNLDQLPARPVAEPSQEIFHFSPSPDVKLGAHPETLRSRFQALRLSREITTARSAFLPTLDLTYSRNWDRNEMGARNRTESNTFAIVAQWQIFNGLSDFHKVQQANLAYEAAELDKEKLERELVSNARSAAVNLHTANARIPSARSLRAAAEERVRTVSAQYRSGLKGYLDWEQAEAQLLDLEQAEMTALNDALMALANYERAMGETLEKP